jgi:hypothetical protein
MEAFDLLSSLHNARFEMSSKVGVRWFRFRVERSLLRKLFSYFFCLHWEHLRKTSATGTAVAPGCGTADAKFDVKTDKAQHPATQPEALVYLRMR